MVSETPFTLDDVRRAIAELCAMSAEELWKDSLPVLHEEIKDSRMRCVA